MGNKVSPRISDVPAVYPNGSTRQALERRAGLGPAGEVLYPWERDPTVLEELLSDKDFRWQPIDFPIPREIELRHIDQGGRCTRELICASANFKRQGMSVESIRGMFGIDGRVWQDWLNRGREGVMPYAVLYLAMEFSRVALERSAVHGWVAAFDKDWRAAQMYLQVTNPGEWASSNRVDVHHSGSATVRHEASKGDLLAIADMLQQVGYVPQGGDRVIEGSATATDQPALPASEAQDGS